MQKKYIGFMKPIKINRVKKLRIWNGIQQKELAKKVGITLSTYRNIELNNRRLRLTEQKKLAEFFGINESQLYEEEQNGSD